jgi:hypothetical protein
MGVVAGEVQVAVESVDESEKRWTPKAGDGRLANGRDVEEVLAWATAIGTLGKAATDLSRLCDETSADAVARLAGALADDVAKWAGLAPKAVK